MLAVAPGEKKPAETRANPGEKTENPDYYSPQTKLPYRDGTPVVSVEEVRFLALEERICWWVRRGGQKHTFGFKEFMNGFNSVLAAEA